MHTRAADRKAERAVVDRLLVARFIGSSLLTANLFLSLHAAKAEPEPTSTQVQTAVQDQSNLATLYRGSQGSPVWDKIVVSMPAILSIHGGYENDIAYAKYTFDNQNNPTEIFYDFRGRAVFGPHLRYEFGHNYFAAAWADYVVWMRELSGVYQGNADDIVAQVGQKDLWDVMVGRFFTWRVYRKGLGYDLYTLEDTGALERTPVEGGTFGPHVYEVNDVFYRGTPGRAAFHLYPTTWSGIEAVVEYGKDSSSTNTLAGRAAGNVTYGPISVSAAAEARRSRLALEVKDMNGVVCDLCNANDRNGYGGGVVLKHWFVEVGGNYAISHYTGHGAVPPGVENINATGKITSFGGYGELDVGSLAMNRKLVLGFGVNRTETLADNLDFRRHVQWAGYAFFPLGFNNAFVKFVFSRADLRTDIAASTPTSPTITYIETKSHMTAGRLRIGFNF